MLMFMIYRKWIASDDKSVAILNGHYAELGILVIPWQVKWLKMDFLCMRCNPFLDILRRLPQPDIVIWNLPAFQGKLLKNCLLNNQIQPPAR